MIKKRKIIRKKAKPMSSYRAVGLAEGFEQGTQAEQKRAWQQLVDTGAAWRLQGSFGRAASDMIASGFLRPPKKKTWAASTDYYGNKINFKKMQGK